jgi:hypothetical protein
VLFVLVIFITSGSLKMMELEKLQKLTAEAVTETDKRARLGRLAILEEMGFFGDDTNFKLAAGEYSGSFIGAVRKRFNGIYGDVRGCEPADMEIAGEMLGVFDDVFDVEATQRSRHLPDAA